MDWRSLSLITAPVSEPVTASEIQDHVRIEATDDDAAYLTTLITAARQSVENRLGRALMQQTWEVTFDRFPESRLIHLPNPPLQSVTSVKYVDSNGTEQTLSSGNYTVRTADEPGTVQLDYDQTWPTTRPEEGAVRVRYVAGYADADSVPFLVRQQIMVMVATMYEHRESVVAGTIATKMPGLVMLDQYRVRW